MNFKPFYIRMTDDITEEQRNEVLDKAVMAGANCYEYYKGMRNKGDDACLLNYEYFGVDCDNNTVMYDLRASYGKDAVEITLDQVDEHLGLNKVKVIDPDGTETEYASYDKFRKPRDLLTEEGIKNMNKDLLVSQLEALGYDVELKKKAPEVKVGQVWVDGDGDEVHVVAIVDNIVIYWYMGPGGKAYGTDLDIDCFKQLTYLRDE